MAWGAILGKIAVAVGTAVLIEHGDEIATGITELFTEKKTKPKTPPSLDKQLAAKETMKQYGAEGLPKLTQEQARNAAAIAEVCNVLKIFTLEQRRAICMALWVNAWQESRFKAGAHNPNGEDSRGLFQINVRAHPQWKDIDLYNPYKNTAAFLILCLKERRFLEQIQSQSVLRLTYIVCRYVERPKNPEQKAQERMAIARQWYSPAVL